MEAIGILGFVIPKMGTVTLIATEIFLKVLKEKGVLQKDYKKE